MAMVSWPFVGREAELERIAAAWRDRRSGAVIRAEAGVGKTRLARQALAAAAAEGALTEWVQATRSAAAVPLAAFASLVPDDVRTDDPVQLMQRCAEDLRRRAGRRPLVLAVDDAQLLDPASAALVLHLAATGAAFALATVRADVPAPDAIDALWKDGMAERVDLGRLDPDGVRKLVEGALGDPVEEAALLWVTDVSDGNALYARELIGGAVDAGTLVHERHFWRLAGTPVAAPSLVEHVSARMRDLDALVRETVELLALAEPLRPHELEEEPLLAAEADGFVVARDGEIALAHPLYGEAVRSALPALRARALRLRLAGTLSAREPFGPEDALRVARLLLDADAPLEPELALTAARAANRAGDPDLAERLATGPGLEVALVLAHAHALRNRFAEAEVVLAAVEGDAPEHAARSDYVKQRVYVQHWGLRTDVAPFLTRASGWTDEARHARLLGRLRAGVSGVAADVDDDPNVPDASRRAIAAGRLLSAHLAGDSRAAAIELLRRRPPVPLRDEGDAALLAALSVVGGEAMQDTPMLASAMEVALADGVRERDDEAAGLAALGLARLALVGGRYRDTARWLAEAEVHLGRRDTFGAIIPLRATAVLLATELGEYEAATLALTRLRDAVRERPPIDPQRWFVVRAEAAVVRLRNENEAAAMLVDAAEEFAATPAAAAPLLYDAFRAGAAGVVLPGVDSAMAAAMRAHVEAVDGAALLAAAEQFAVVGADRPAVEAAAQAAAAFVQEGRHDSARRAAARARALHPVGQGGELPRIDGLDGVAVELTRREAQLVELARQGHSNAEIADRLVLSVRTVETHLYRGMTKLGVRDRRDL